ncbi:hypothetical protein L1987_03101 [Smallanthus sonchifolius]|uniref:Uncharacterized protein n=1 Tax=Smallanthus sonchifolius TaxID=185202 RepID=A0ACB9K9T3_9ASTR|nr:hypothetical protein L1987_03101 [Smallanthus sonchifolius]
MNRLEDGGVTAALDVVMEVGAEEVFEVDAVREAEKAVNLESDRRGGGEHVCDLIVEAVAVAEESDEVSDEWVGLGTWGFHGGVTATGESVEEGG